MKQSVEAPPATASPRRGWCVVAVCMVAYAFSFIDRQILSLLIGPIQADLKLSDTEFGLLSGLAFAIFYAALGLPIATWADRKSRPLLITAGVAFWSLATVGCGLAQTFWPLFAARVCVGAGEAALTPATYSLLSDLFPKDRLGRAAAVYSLGSFVGAGVAFLVGGAVIGLAAAHGGFDLAGWPLRPWQLVFVIVGLPGLLIAGLIALTIREPYAGGRRPAAETPPFSAVIGFLAAERRIFLPHIGGFVMGAMALFAVLGWAPAFLMRRFDLTPAQSGLWLGPIAIVAGGGGCLSSGWLMDWLTRRGDTRAPFRTGIIGALGAGATAAALPFAWDVTSGVLLVGLTLYFASFPMPPATGVIQIAAPPRLRSRVSAVFISLNSLIGLAVGNGLIGALNDHLFQSPKAVGASLALVTSLAGFLSAALLAMGLRPYGEFVRRTEGRPDVPLAAPVPLKPRFPERM